METNARTAGEQTDLIRLAGRFVNQTRQHIFLTGKAGTGKTTFLHTLAESTHKKCIIVAPTGIAALNAKGVTIHSQFLLPPGTFLPDRNPPSESEVDQYVYTPYTLSRKHPLNSIRKQVLRDIDLLIIDEVSMLRADLLDAIDTRLRAARRNFHMAFGGVQVLMIGDLFQLPPVVRDNEWTYLNRYYPSPHFFQAHALKAEGFVYIELDKIFRQSDTRFISLLNNLRNNVVTPADIELLNEHYKPESEISNGDGVITVTTHNYRADEINQQALLNLPGKMREFYAEIEDEFPENLYPIPRTIQLKIGAQVMFIRNDSNGGKYFNGKLAKVVEFDEEDGIVVEMAGDSQRYTLQKHEWQNKKYTINSSSRDLDEEVVGIFRHFPIKLAWAITVHKSQGLTFEKAIIDVGKAFAPGQVYVALSRLRSLDGLILRTRIDPGVIATDPQVQVFSSARQEGEALQIQLQSRQSEFLNFMIRSAFDFSGLREDITHLIKTRSGLTEFEDAGMRSALETILHAFEQEKINLEKFRNQLGQLLTGRSEENLLDRVKKGSAYYDTILREQMKILLRHMEEVRQLSRTKTYYNELAELDLMLNRKREEIGKSAYLAECILEGKDIEKNKATSPERVQDRAGILQEVREAVAAQPMTHRTKTGRIRKSKSDKEKGHRKETKKGSTYEETFGLFRAGMSIEEIAGKRQLTPGTIESHLARGIRSSVIDVRKIVTEETLNEILTAFEHNPETPMGTVYHRLNEQYTFGQLRMVQAFLQVQGAEG